MTRTQACRDKLGWIEENCPLDRTSVFPINRANDFCADHVEISTLATDAVQPLIKIKDANVLKKVLASLKTSIDSGKKPTRKVVEICIKKVHHDAQPQLSTNELITAKQEEILKCQDKLANLQNTLAALEMELETLKKQEKQEALFSDPAPIPTSSDAAPDTDDAQFLADKPKHDRKPKNIGVDAVMAKFTGRISEPVREGA